MPNTALRDPLALVGAAALAVFLGLAAKAGGFQPTVWYGGGIFLLLLLAAAAWAGVVPRRALGRFETIGFVAFVLFGLWSLLSIAWSAVPGTAWDGANRTLLYVAVYALFALAAWRVGTASWVLFAFSVGAFALGLGWFAAAALAADPDPYFISGRFSAPIDYQNGNAALFLMAFWPAVAAAAHRDVPIAARAIGLAAATGLLELAILTQSRAALAAGVPGALVIFLFLVPRRARALAFLLIAAAATLPAVPLLLDVFPAVAAGESGGELEAALAVLGATSAAAGFVGGVLAWVDRRYEVPPRVGTAFGASVAAAVVGVLALAAATHTAQVAHPLRTLEAKWSEFSDVESTAGSEAEVTSNFARGVRGNRYDLWRVALLEFRESPLEGVGADNFAVDYLRERRSVEETLFPHSIELRTLAQTGIVGTGLLAIFLVTAVVGVLGRRREAVAWATAPAATAFAYWFLHGSVDWFWELPGLAAPAFALLGIGMSVSAERGGETQARRRWPSAAIAAASLAVATMFLFPWLSAKETAAAAGSWRTDAAGAFARLDRARSLNPLTEEPDLVAGAIASRLDDGEQMRRAFERALERNPYSWYAFFELALNAAEEGRRPAARELLARARLLNPREPAIADVEGMLRDGRPIDPDAFDRLFLERVLVTGR